MTAFDSMEGFARHLVDRFGEKVVAVIEYGSTVTGNATAGFSKHNSVIVLSDLSIGTLAELTDPLRRWQKAGQPLPVLLTPGDIEEAHEVFPAEFLDILAHRQIVVGRDVFANLRVETRHLRHQLEYESRSML